MSHMTRFQSLTSISPSISGRNRPNPRQARRGGCRAAIDCRFSTLSVSGSSSRRRSFAGFVARTRASETSLIVSITSDCKWREAVRTKSSEGILEGEDDAGEGVSATTSESWFDRFLKLPEDGSKIWEAPWGKTVMIQVMVMWFVAFCTVGNAVFPYTAGVLGFDTSTFTQRGLAFYSLCLDFAQMLTTVFILRQSLRPFQPLAENWFSVKWSKDRKWLKDVALACLAFPVVVWLHGASTSILEHFGILVFDENVSSAWEQSMKSNDVVSKVFYMLLASFAAPVWEEVIFRGFFFASLTSFTGTKRSMMISSTIFAFAHFSMEQFLPLTLLGCLMCVVFVRTRTLIAPILLHALWNAWVLASEFHIPASFLENVLMELQSLMFRY